MHLVPGGEDHRRIVAQLHRLMPPAMRDALEEAEVEEISLNPDGRLWIKRLGQDPEAAGTMSYALADGFLKTFASLVGEPIRTEYPIVNGELPSAARLAGALPTITTGPMFSIRKPAILNLNLLDYVCAGVMPEHLAATLQDAVRARKNILVSGGTASGKTTLVNTLIGLLALDSPADRLVILEDLAEVRTASENVVRFRTRPSVSMTDLLRLTLRSRPDRIIVGEVRGPEALDLLRAWGTGHPGGLCTLHANDAPAALRQLELLISMSPDAPSDARIGHVVAQNVDLVVQVRATPHGRKVTTVLEVLGYDHPHYQTRTLYGDHFK